MFLSCHRNLRGLPHREYVSRNNELTPSQITRAYYKHLRNRAATFARGILGAAIYDKTMKLSGEQLQKFEAATLTTTDMESIQHAIQILHDVWASALELGVSVYILATITGPAAFLVLIPTVCKSNQRNQTLMNMALIRCVSFNNWILGSSQVYDCRSTVVERENRDESCGDVKHFGTAQERQNNRLSTVGGRETRKTSGR